MSWVCSGGSGTWGCVSPAEGMELPEGLVCSEGLGPKDERTARPECPLADDDVRCPLYKDVL